VSLPPEIGELEAGGLTAFVLRGFMLPTVPVSVVGTDVVIDLPTVLAAFAPEVPTTLAVQVRSLGGPDGVQLGFVLQLTGAPGVPETTVTLDLATALNLQRLRLHDLGPVVAAPGATVAVVGAPGFWNEGPLEGIDVRVESLVGGLPELGDALPIEVSPDGSTLTFTVPVPTGTEPLVVIHTYADGFALHELVGDLISPSADPVEAYVVSVYRDLFGRAPDPTGLAGWSRALRNGVPYSAVADAITASHEFRSGLITDAYQWYLGRSPDPAGLQGWLDAMDRGLPIQQMEAGFLASDEYFANAYGTRPLWVAQLYMDVLGRWPSTEEANAWSIRSVFVGRTEVARGFLYSTEYLTGVVDGYYRWLLGRPIDAVGQVGWVRAIQNGVRAEAIIAGIIASDEYRNNVATN
jgi:hypothetical protein